MSEQPGLKGVLVCEQSLHCGLPFRPRQARTSETLPRCWRTSSGPNATLPNTHAWATCLSRRSWRETTWKRETTHTHRRNWAVPKPVLTCVWNWFPGLLWILCLYVPHSVWSVASAAFDAGVCVWGNQVHAHSKNADVTQFYLDIVYGQDLKKK